MVAESVDRLRRQSGLEIGLTVVGPADDRKNWPSYCLHLEGVSDAEVHEWIGRSWVLAAPSSYEGFGIPAFEGLALGTPVVTSPTPGAEFLRSLLDGHVGFDIVPDQDFTDALAAVLLASPPDQTSMPLTQVEPVLELAETERLVGEVYQRAIDRFERSRRRRS
ncbi:hypothetical protein ASG04_09835 [Curtobacterium sp. Leaf183]|nr:hypothetical protein ASG04_09835 [Curtobacterium sp. Leaf183]